MNKAKQRKMSRKHLSQNEFIIQAVAEAARAEIKLWPWPAPHVKTIQDSR